MSVSHMMRSCVSSAAFLSALLGAQAYAQTASQTDRTSDWAGPYVGVQIGYQDMSADHSFSNGAPSDDAEPSGFIGGAHAGYNWRHHDMGVPGQMVFGIEADAEGGELDGDFANPSGGTSVGGTEVNWEASLRGRFGITSGANLFYVTAGAAWINADFSGGPLPGPACCGYSDTLTGWTAGLGVERVWNGGFTYRLEYRYAEYEDASSGLPPAFPGVTMPVDLDSDSLRAAISYHF